MTALEEVIDYFSKLGEVEIQQVPDYRSSIFYFEGIQIYGFSNRDLESDRWIEYSGSDRVTVVRNLKRVLSIRILS